MKRNREEKKGGGGGGERVNDGERVNGERVNGDIPPAKHSPPGGNSR